MLESVNFENLLSGSSWTPSLSFPNEGDSRVLLISVLMLSTKELDELDERLHRLGASDDHLLGLEEQESEEVDSSWLEEFRWSEILQDFSQFLSRVKVNGHPISSGDFLSLIFQAIGILQSLDLAECTYDLLEDPRTITALCSLAMKFHSQLLHMNSDLPPDPVYEGMLLKLAKWQVVPTTDHWLSIFELRLSTLKPSMSQVAKQLYQRSLLTASMAVFRGQFGKARSLASSHFLLSCHEAGKMRQLSVSIDELVWILGLAHENQIVELQSDIKHAEAVVIEAARLGRPHQAVGV